MDLVALACAYEDMRYLTHRRTGVIGMLTDRAHPIDVVPLLSRGKHRNPRKGACFMEFASYLAGERWTDHPACTHPLLAELARQVNDHVSEDARQTLLGLVPDVIGLTGSDLRIDINIALRAARTALPVVPEEWQRVMAVAVLSCERLLADLDGRPGAALSRQSQDVLALAPGAATWARRYRRSCSISRRVFRRETAPTIVGYAVHGIAQSSVPDPDRLLRDLLVGAIDDCERGTQHPEPAASGATSAAAPDESANAAVDVLRS